MSMLVAALAFLPTVLASRDQFTLWFPQWQAKFTEIIEGSCSGKYQEYLTLPTPGNCSACLEMGVVNCLLQNFDEVGKANMQSAAVLLGLTPSMLSLLGSSAAETALLSLQRPLLAFLTAAGSPSVNPIRAFEYNNPIEAMKVRVDHIPLRKWTRREQPIVAMAELIVALAAIANVGELGYRLGIRAISSFSVKTTFLPLLWNFIAVLIHVGGSIALRLMVSIESDTGLPSESIIPHSIVHWMSREFVPCIAHGRMVLKPKKESLAFLVVSWVTSTGTVIHIIFGTLAFSSMLFISVEDGVSVILRYIFSALVCRIIVMYELAGMRESST